jgi:hypothetical protein
MIGERFCRNEQVALRKRLAGDGICATSMLNVRVVVQIFSGSKVAREFVDAAGLKVPAEDQLNDDKLAVPPS